MAARYSFTGNSLMFPVLKIFLKAKIRATNPPVIAAVRVPPSAWITSQSIQIVCSPSTDRFTTERNERPINR